MKYYSEVLKKTFDSEKECLKAEHEYEVKLAEEERNRKKLADERKARAKEIEDARNEVLKAQKKYSDLINAFVKDYKSFHMTYSTKLDDTDFVKSFFEFF